MALPVVHVIRGEKVESIHRGDIVAVNTNGKIIFEYGSKDKRTFWRSSAKPFQTIPLVESGGLEQFNIEAKELALICASHGGEEKHVKTVKTLLKKIGKTVDDLDCGLAKPMYSKAYIKLIKENKTVTQANNPCSGKHTGMLALGVLRDYDLKNYILKSHPIQQEMLQAIAEMTKLPIEAIDLAIDGCGVPVFGLPIKNMAIAYAQLAKKKFKSNKRDQALKKITEAMTQFPFYVAGTRRLDTILMEETDGKILAKLGAEAVYCLSILEKDIGIAMKIEDGAYRALDALVPDLLLKHGYITKKEYMTINERLKLEIKNHRKEVVGKIISVI
jgi:L-asparaginase II